MYLKAILTLGAFLATSGCATAPDTAVVTVRFAEQALTGSLPGSFREIDGKDVARNPEEITITAGKHSIGYACPNTILMDGPLRTDGQFEAGATYLLRCAKDGIATFEKQ